MNILYYSQRLLTKALSEGIVYYITREISKKNNSIIQFNFSYKRELPKAPIGNAVSKPVFIPNIPKFRAIYKELAPFIYLNKNIKKYNIDIMHTHFLVPGAMGSYVAKKNNIPHVITEHGMIYFQLKRKIEMKMIKYAIKNTDKIICVDKNIYNILLDMIKDEEKLEYITNGVDTNRFYPIYKERNPKRVLFMSRLVDWKGPDFLIRTIPNIIKQIPDAEFWFLGAGPLKKDLEKKSKTLGINKNVKFWGFVPRDLQVELINKCSVFTSLQQYENFTSLALFEAMACALPVIATDVGQTRKIVKTNGFLVRNGDEEDLTDKLINLLESPRKTRYMGRISKRMVEKSHTWEMVAKKYENVYKELVR